MSQKKVYIEFLRIVACFLVIVNHTNSRIFLSFSSTPPPPVWFASLTYFFISKIAVPLFLMIMGAILLGKQDTPQKSKRRLLRAFLILTAASAAYYVYYAHRNAQPIQINVFLDQLFRLHATNAFWYLYLYLGLLCLLPVLQKLVKVLSKQELQWLIFLSMGIMGLVPLIRIFAPDVSISGSFMMAFFSPCVGVVLCGYYIEHYMVINRKKAFLSCIIFVVLIVFQVLGTYDLFIRDSTNYLGLDNRDFITITGSAACFYMISKYIFSRVQLNTRVEKAICSIGGLTFGIYLLGDWMIQINPSVWIDSFLCRHMPAMPAMVLWEMFIFTACAVLVAFFKKLLSYISRLCPSNWRLL